MIKVKENDFGKIPATRKTPYKGYLVHAVTPFSAFFLSRHEATLIESHCLNLKKTSRV